MVLLYRLCALYNNAKRFRLIVGVLYILEAGGMIISVAYTQTHFTVSLMELPGAYLCRAMNVSKVSLVIWPVTLAYEAVMFCLAIVKFLSDLKDIRAISSMRNFSLIKIVLIDSLIYFGMSVFSRCMVGLNLTKSTTRAFFLYLGITLTWVMEPVGFY
ncbi:hypothetical protein BDQ17DRAFT_675645 [Cyathus striatus]|nr:hypothetical protein BDQ17DRAFT_675645 [Cyathus striatus]